MHANAAIMSHNKAHSNTSPRASPETEPYASDNEHLQRQHAAIQDEPDVQQPVHFPLDECFVFACLVSRKLLACFYRAHHTLGAWGNNLFAGLLVVGMLFFWRFLAKLCGMYHP